MLRNILLPLMKRLLAFMIHIKLPFTTLIIARMKREIMIARSNHNRTLFVFYTIRGEKIRIISARLATKREKSDYEAGI
jgi:uncharacterized DUF497 family protein